MTLREISRSEDPGELFICETPVADRTKVYLTSVCKHWARCLEEGQRSRGSESSPVKIKAQACDSSWPSYSKMVARTKAPKLIQAHPAATPECTESRAHLSDPAVESRAELEAGDAQSPLPPRSQIHRAR